jgi:hypothetical protein
MNYRNRIRAALKAQPHDASRRREILEALCDALEQGGVDEAATALKCPVDNIEVLFAQKLHELRKLL